MGFATRCVGLVVVQRKGVYVREEWRTVSLDAACPMKAERTQRGQREFEDTKRLVTHWGQ